MSCHQIDGRTTYVRESGLNRVAVVDKIPMPTGEIDGPREIERMSFGFACIEHDQADLRPRGAPAAGIPVPADYFWLIFAGLHRL